MSATHIIQGRRHPTAPRPAWLCRTGAVPPKMTRRGRGAAAGASRFGFDGFNMLKIKAELHLRLQQEKVSQRFLDRLHSVLSSQEAKQFAAHACALTVGLEPHLHRPL